MPRENSSEDTFWAQYFNWAQNTYEWAKLTGRDGMEPPTDRDSIDILLKKIACYTANLTP